MTLSREYLESNYDRPSFHCDHMSHRAIGYMSAIMEAHVDLNHPELVNETQTWYFMNCPVVECDFNCQDELMRLYPWEGGDDTGTTES